MQPEIPESKRHPRFFVSEQFITLKVDEVYFNVPTFILRKHSKKLEKLIADQTETDPECFAPLVQGIGVVDLERFLAVLFPTEYGQYEATSFDEWASILKVAHHWEFESIVDLALEKIEPVSSPVDKVVLGKTYNIPEWATEARVLLCRREEPITLEEASRMEMEEVVNISQTRHHIRSSEIRSGLQDSTIRSLLSGEQSDEQLTGITETASLTPGVSQAAHSDSTMALGEAPAGDASVVHKDLRISRAIELRAQLKVLKSQLASLNARPGMGGLALGKEAEDVEIQIDDLEEQYFALYDGLQSEKGSRFADYNYNAVLSIERTSTAESCVQSMLTGCLHPDSRRLGALFINFPLLNKHNGMRKRPQQITLNILDRYGLKYTTDAPTGTITVPLASLN